MAKNEKKSLENRLHEADLKLEELGGLDAVNAFLATQEAKAEVGAVYDNWRNDMSVFAAKMPEVAHGVTDKVLKAIEMGKNDFEKASFLYFKTLMGDAMAVKPVDFASGHKMLCLDTLKSMAQEVCEKLTATVKIDIAEVAFFTFETKEHVDALYDVLKAEPNGNELVALMKRRLRIIAARSLMMMMNPFFGQSGQS